MPTVLFICVENTFRSVLSEAIFNGRAPPGWTGESGGVSPVDRINPALPELLQEIGISLGPKTPRLVTRSLVADADRVITFACFDRCPPGARGKGEDWPLPGATGKIPGELRRNRDELTRRIDRLIGSLRRAQP